MPLCRYFQILSRLSVVGVVLFAGVSLTAGERIRFSKPAVELAAPGADLPKLPEPQERTMDFGSSVPPAGMDTTLQMRPQIIPLPTRRPAEEDLSPLTLRDPNRRFERAMLERDRLNGRDPLELRDPSRPNDPSKRDLENGATPAPWSLDSANARRKDEGRSLSPITEFGWEARDPGRRSTDSSRTGRNAANDRERQTDRSPST
jgi:hypothetical protein